MASILQEECGHLLLVKVYFRLDFHLRCSQLSGLQWLRTNFPDNDISALVFVDPNGFIKILPVESRSKNLWIVPTTILLHAGVVGSCRSVELVLFLLAFGTIYKRPFSVRQSRLPYRGNLVHDFLNFFHCEFQSNMQTIS